MWHRMTDNVRRATFFAQEEASNWGHNYVSTEHLLLGLLRDEGSTACRIFRHLGMECEAVARSARQAMEKGAGRSYYEIQMAADAKCAFELSQAESRAQNTSYIGTEHLLLGLLQADGLAGRVLSEAGLTPDSVRQARQDLEAAAAVPPEPVSPVSPCEPGPTSLRPPEAPQRPWAARPCCWPAGCWAAGATDSILRFRLPSQALFHRKQA